MRIDRNFRLSLVWSNISFLSSDESVCRQFLTDWFGQFHNLSFGIDQRIPQGVETEVACNGQRHGNFGRSLRLIEAGADLDRVLVIDDSEVQLTLSDERIEKAIVENNARLVIIDPIQAYLGADVDMNRANEVRPIFMRLGQVAQRTGCAILLIGHLNKAAGMQSLQRGLGSIDIAAAVRSVMFIGKLKHDPTMRILTHEKSSLAPPGVSLAFSLGDEGGFRWVGEYDITADEMLSGIEPQRETKTQQAKDLICTLLAGGKQVLSEDIDKAALERGIPGRTVRDAKRELGDALKSKIVEGRKKVFWME